MLVAFVMIKMISKQISTEIICKTKYIRIIYKISN